MSDRDLPLNEYDQRAIDRGVRNIRERLCQDLCDATRERISDAALAILAGNPRNRDSALARELRECRAALRVIYETAADISHSMDPVDPKSNVWELARMVLPARLKMASACLPREGSDE